MKTRPDFFLTVVSLLQITVEHLFSPHILSDQTLNLKGSSFTLSFPLPLCSTAPPVRLCWVRCVVRIGTVSSLVLEKQEGPAGERIFWSRVRVKRSDWGRAATGPPPGPTVADLPLTTWK